MHSSYVETFNCLPLGNRPIIPSMVGSDGPPKHDLTLHAADTPNTRKVACVLESPELEVPYDCVFVGLVADEQKQPMYATGTPIGHTPTLVDRSIVPPFAVFESGAIMLCIMEKYGGARTDLLPADLHRRSEVVQWLIWQQSGLGPLLGQCMYFKRIAYPVAKGPALFQMPVERFEKEAIRLLNILETRLTGRDYLCGAGQGAFALADIACWGYASQGWWTGVSYDKMPNLRRWLALCGQRRTVQASVRIPGISQMKGLPLFADFAEGAINKHTTHQAVENNARSQGREHFGFTC